MKPLAAEIPPAELDVLSALWRIGCGTVRDVQARLVAEGRNLAYNTVLTLLGRLQERGCVAARRDGRAHEWVPRISREVVLTDRLTALVEQLGGGEAAPLILNLVQTHKLSNDDVRQLRALLGQLEAEQSPDTETKARRKSPRPGT